MGTVMIAKPRKPLLVNLTWAAVAVLALPLLYVLSFGPACWMTSQTIGPFTGEVRPELLPRRFMRVYVPLGRLSLDESPAGELMRWWVNLGLDDGEGVVVPTAFSGDQSLIMDK